MRVVAAADSGAASGVVNVAHQLGGTLDLAVLVTVFAAATRNSQSPEMGLAQGTTAGLLSCAALAILGLIHSVTLIVPFDRSKP